MIRSWVRSHTCSGAQVQRPRAVHVMCYKRSCLGLHSKQGCGDRRRLRDKALTTALDAPTSHPYLLTTFEFFHAIVIHCIRPVINRPYNITWVLFPPPAPSRRCLPSLPPSFLPSSRSGTILPLFLLVQHFSSLHHRPGHGSLSSLPSPSLPNPTPPPP